MSDESEWQERGSELTILYLRCPNQEMYCTAVADWSNRQINALDVGANQLMSGGGDDVDVDVV